MKNDDGDMSVCRADWQTYYCDECGDVVIIPSPPYNGVLMGVCCTCRDVRVSYTYYDFEKHTWVNNTGHGFNTSPTEGDEQ